MLLVARNRAPPHTEDLEEFVVEALGLSLLVRLFRPLAGESSGARASRSTISASTFLIR